MSYERFLRDAIILWATIDPVSTVLIFAALTASSSEQERKRIALKATVYATLVLLGAIVIGQFLLSAMGINMVSFQVAGGIVLFLFAVQLMFGGLDQRSMAIEASDDIAVFPLALPTIATSGAILAVIVLTDNHLYPLPVQAGTAVITLAILGVSYGMMRAADPILGAIGKQGARMLVRVMA